MDLTSPKRHCSRDEWDGHICEISQQLDAKIAFIWDEQGAPIKFSQANLLHAIAESGDWIIPTDKGIGVLFCTTINGNQMVTALPTHVPIPVQTRENRNRIRVACALFPTLIVTYRLLQYLDQDKTWMMVGKETDGALTITYLNATTNEGIQQFIEDYSIDTRLGFLSLFGGTLSYSSYEKVPSHVISGQSLQIPVRAYSQVHPTPVTEILAGLPKTTREFANSVLCGQLA